MSCVVAFCPKKSILATSICGLSLFAVMAQAGDLPAVNLGLTTFYDGAPIPGGPGWSTSLYSSHYEGRKITDRHGDEIGLPKSTTNIDVTALQLIYQDGARTDVNWGLSFILPVLTKAKVDDGMDNAVLDAQEGVGDLRAGAYLQFEPVMGENGPLFAHRLELDVVVPTGKYDKNHAINPGSNFWSINPYWAATLWLTPKTSVTWNAYYLWNAKNDDPSPALYGANAEDMQAGQAVHLNFNAAYALTQQLHVGVNGYWLKQFTDTEINGHAISGRREQVFAIGPGAMYAISRNDLLYANLYFESEAENRTEGNRFVFRWVHKL